MSFNNAQNQAIAHKDGPCMVLAGPGSGKTTVIANRIHHLIEKHKVSPNEILVITFSKAASKEMKARFLALPNAKKEVTFGTFHGIFYGILKWAYNLTANNIFSEEEKYELLQHVIERMDFNIEDEQDFLQDIAGEISIFKNSRISREEYRSINCEEEEFFAIFDAYERERKRKKKVDFDDMLTMTLELFLARPDVLKLWQQKYRYILVDEFQDINQVQYDVIRMMAAPENNLFIVGDDDQSIYGFRGAKPEIMKQFATDYAKAKRFLLDINYRSTKSIVKGAARVISHNQERYEKQIITTNEQGANIHVQEVRHPIEESKYIIGEITKRLKQGVAPSEIAVLYRTNEDARCLVESLMEHAVSFNMKEHFPNLYEHFIGRNLMAYMKIALGDTSRKLFLEIANRPNRYIGRDSLDKGQICMEDLRKFYEDKEWMQDRIDQLELDLRVIKRCAPFAAIQYIRKQVGYEDYLYEYARKRRIKVEELLDVLDEIQERAKPFQSIQEWLDYICEYTEGLRKREASTQMNEKAVQLMTMHGAKGLEFDTVFIVGANETIVPYKKAETKEEIEEERRLFYVAMTRAKKKLVISYYKERNGKKLEASRFVGELLNLKKI